MEKHRKGKAEGSIWLNKSITGFMDCQWLPNTLRKKESSFDGSFFLSNPTQMGMIKTVEVFQAITKYTIEIGMRQKNKTAHAQIIDV